MKKDIIINHQFANDMVNKKAYIRPVTNFVTSDGSYLMLSISCNNGDVKMTFNGEEEDASLGMSRKGNSVWDSDWDLDLNE